MCVFSSYYTVLSTQLDQYTWSVSVLIRYPRDRGLILWSQTEAQKKTKPKYSQIIG